MSLKKFICRMISFVLCVCMLVEFSTFAQATEAASALYLKDIKLIYADSADEAAKKLPEGYTLYEQDINDGTGELGVYICYSTTDNAEEAITDIRIMNENGGFDRGTFNDKMDDALEKLGEQAEDIHSAIVNEFVPNLENGLPGAKYAYEQLNIFMYDDETPLGDYIKDGKLTSDDIAKMLLVCHSTILAAFMSLIAQGLQCKEGEDWLDKLEDMDIADYEMNEDIQQEYADLVERFQGPMSDFSDQYNIMVYTDEVRDSMTVDQIALYSEDLASEETVQWWYSLWEILNSHTLGGDSGWTTEYLLVEWNLGEGVAPYKICMILDALTEGQKTVMQLIGPINFILNDIFTEEDRIQAEEGLAELKEENGTVSLWGGIDTDVFNSEVGITSEAYDEMVTSNNYNVFTQENDVLTKSVEDYISIIANYSSIVSASMSILSGVAMLTKGSTYIVCKVIARVCIILTKSLMGMIFMYTAITITFLCLLANLIIWIIKEIQAGKPPEHDRTTIPKYMIDSVIDNSGAQIYETYKRVDNVQADSEIKNEDWGLSDVKNMSGSDINANKGYNWAAIYVSYSESVGEPVEAEFAVSEEIDLAPEGFIPLRQFNRKSEAADLNGGDEYNANDPDLYLYYRGEKLPEDHCVYKYIRQIQAVSVDLRDPNNPDKYRFSADEALAVARKLLDGASPEYYVIDHNFSSDPDIVTLIGWNGTNQASEAIKDIRLVYKSTVSRSGGGAFGGITYANMGDINDWSLFVCRMKDTEIPPVTKIRVMKKGDDPSSDYGISLNMNESETTLDSNGEKDYGIGWEPVNEFTGGEAVPLGEAGVQMYFMPEETFTEGPDYLAGIETDAYITNEGFYESGIFANTKNCCHVDLWDNEYEKYQDYKERVCGEYFFDDSIIFTVNNSKTTGIPDELHGYMSDNPDCPYIGMYADELMPPDVTSSVKYHLTKNPYRAIYGLSMRTYSDDERRSSFINYDGYGYVLCPVEITTSMCGMKFNEFEYDDLLESSRGFDGKTFVVEDREFHSEGVVVNCDITQTMWPYDDLSINSVYISGHSPDRDPLTVDDLMFSTVPLEEGEYPDTYIPTPFMGGDGSEVESIAPFVQDARAQVWDYSNLVYVRLFQDLYCYFRSEVGTGGNVTTYKPGTGQYIQSLLLTSKEKIRTESLLPNNSEAECKDISYSMLEIQLVNLGATTTYDVNIGTDYYEDGNDNANTVYLGLTRTDDASRAIRDIRFYVCQPGEKPEKTIKAEIEVNGRTQSLEYELVDDVSITSKANLDCEKVINSRGMEVWEEKELLEERQAYLYVCRNKTAFPEAITDVQITDWCSFGTFEPILSFKGETIYTVKKQSDVNLHVKDAWFEEGDMFSFKREGNNDRYISELAIRNGGEENKVRSSLIEAGYSVINKDMNEFAAGDHIYIGCKYTDNKDDAITDVMTIHEKDKYDAYSVTDERHIYDLVADVDLNKGAGGDYIYLYTTKDSRAGSPIVEIYGTDNVKDHTDTLYNHQTVRRLWDFKYSNLNAGTTVFTADIYLVMKREGNTGKYISDVMVAYGWSRSGALDKLKDAGYVEYIDKDLNDGTGASQWVYLGYKRTDDPEKAIRNLVVHYHSPDTITVDNYEYTLVSDVNLNRHCSIFSTDLFLYYTKDASAGDPITELYCSSTPVEYKKDDRGYHKTVTESYGSHSYMDLNEGALGDYIYLVMVSQPENFTVSKETKYSLTVEGGTSERYEYTEGELVTVTVNEDLLEYFTNWSAVGHNVIASRAANTSYTFSMPGNDVTITAVVEPPKYLVTLPDGAVFINGPADGRFAEGDTVQIKWNDPSMHLDYWTIKKDGKSSIDRNNPLSFTMPGVAIVISAGVFPKTTEIALEMDPPIVGESLAATASYSFNIVNYTADVEWFDGDATVTTAESGKTYLAVITLSDVGTNGLVFSESGTATVNGAAAESWERVTNGVEVTIHMDAADDSADTEESLMASVISTLFGNGSWISVIVLSVGLVGAAIFVIIYMNRRKAKH